MLKNCIKAFLVLVLVVVLGIAFFRNRLCETLISAAAAKTTGLTVSLEKINLDVLNSTLQIRGLTLLNPPGFRPKALGRLEEAFVKYDLLDCLRGRIHLRQAKVRISEISIIRNEKGKSNISGIRRKPDKKVKVPASPSQAIAATSTQPRPKFAIDRLEVFPGKITFIDYRTGIGEPVVIIVTTKGPFVFKDVGDLNSVVNSVSAKAGFRYLLDNFTGIILP